MKMQLAFVTRAAIVLLLLSWSLQTAAQAVPDYDQRAFYASKYYKYKKMKTIGLVMTLGGAVLSIAGINKVSNASYTVNSYGQQVYTNDDGTTGVLMFLVGAPLVGAGVPLSIVGNIKSKKYARLMEATSVGGRLSPRHAGVTLTLRF